MVTFESLPLAEKRYNIQLALQTLRTILALGYQITMDKPPARIRSVRLPNEPYLQSNGFKPAPLDLSAVELSSKMEELVDKLAENTHNVWARYEPSLYFLPAANRHGYEVGFVGDLRSYSSPWISALCP